MERAAGAFSCGWCRFLRYNVWLFYKELTLDPLPPIYASIINRANDKLAAGAAQVVANIVTEGYRLIAIRDRTQLRVRSLPFQKAYAEYKTHVYLWRKALQREKVKRQVDRVYFFLADERTSLLCIEGEDEQTAHDLDFLLGTVHDMWREHVDGA